MHGTVSQKIGRVIVNLLSHPQYISRCVAHNVINGKTPLDLEVPWFSYAAIDFLDGFVLPDMSVFEFGSGGSTVFFAKRARKVFSVEDNISWYEWVSRRLQQKGLTNAELRLCPFNFKDPVGFENSDYLRAMPDEKFDVVVVDGSEEWTYVRPVCFELAETRVKEGGIIVVDDSWRYPGLRRNHRAKELKIFQSW